MTSKITDRMRATPLKLDAYKTCLECSDFQAFKSNKDNETNQDMYNNMRLKCMDCQMHEKKDKNESRSTYKFDAIYSAMAHYEHNTFKRNIGKKSTVEKRYGKKIDEKIQEGKSQRQIAEELGISRTTIHNYLKNKNGTF